MEKKLYTLPEGWEWKSLADVTVKTSNFSPAKSPKQKYTYIDISSIDRASNDIVAPKIILGADAPSRAKKEIQPKDILFATTRPNLKNIALYSGEFEFPVASTGFCILRSTNKVYEEFLFYFLISDLLQKQIAPFISGAQYPAITDKKLKYSQIPLPPIEEQKRIVTKLSGLFTRIDTAITHLQDNLKLTKDLFASVLDGYFNQLFELYETKRLSEMSKVISGFAFKSSDFSDVTGIKSVKITNVGLKDFIETKGNYLPNKYAERYSRFTVNKGDIVIALTRSVINGGLKVCMVPDNYHGALINQRVAAISTDNGKVFLNYIYWYFKTSKVLNYVLNKSKSLNQPNLSIKNLLNLKLPNLPFDQQLGTVEDINDLFKRSYAIETATKEKLRDLETLKSSLLDNAFRGQL